MSRQAAESTISFSVQALKVTSELLKELCRTFLNSPPKHGKIKYGDIAKMGKLESIEVTENNIGDFLQTAKNTILTMPSSVTALLHLLLIMSFLLQDIPKTSAKPLLSMQEECSHSLQISLLLTVSRSGRMQRSSLGNLLKELPKSICPNQTLQEGDVMDSKNTKQLLLRSIPLIVVGWFGNKVSKWDFIADLVFLVVKEGKRIVGQNILFHICVNVIGKRYYLGVA